MFSLLFTPKLQITIIYRLVRPMSLFGYLANWIVCLIDKELKYAKVLQLSLLNNVVLTFWLLCKFCCLQCQWLHFTFQVWLSSTRLVWCIELWNRLKNVFTSFPKKYRYIWECLFPSLYYHTLLLVVIVGLWG